MARRSLSVQNCEEDQAELNWRSFKNKLSKDKKGLSNYHTKTIAAEFLRERSMSLGTHVTMEDLVDASSLHRPRERKKEGVFRRMSMDMISAVAQAAPQFLQSNPKDEQKSGNQERPAVLFTWGKESTTRSVNSQGIDSAPGSAHVAGSGNGERRGNLSKQSSIRSINNDGDRRGHWHKTSSVRSILSNNSSQGSQNIAALSFVRQDSDEHPSSDGCGSRDGYAYPVEGQIVGRMPRRHSLSTFREEQETPMDAVAESSDSRRVSGRCMRRLSMPNIQTSAILVGLRGEDDELGFDDISDDEDDSVVLPMVACFEVSTPRGNLEDSLASIEASATRVDSFVVNGKNGPRPRSDTLSDEDDESLGRIEAGISDFVASANVRREALQSNLGSAKATGSDDFSDETDFAEDELTEEERSRLEKAISAGREKAAKSKKEIHQTIEDAEDLEMMMLEDQAQSCRLLS
jgi:hypothetical protein